MSDANNRIMDNDKRLQCHTRANLQDEMKISTVELT